MRQNLFQSDSLNLNCDGTTTLSQKKLQRAVINGMVLSVNEIPDGSADSMIADISHELQKLRDIPHALNLPNADKINWTLIMSSSSDSASTQKRFNRFNINWPKKKEKRIMNGLVQQVNAPTLPNVLKTFVVCTLVLIFGKRFLILQNQVP